MPRKSQYVTETGVDFFNGEFHCNRKLQYDLTPDDNPVGFGKTVTPRAANEMVKRKIKEKIQAAVKNMPVEIKGQASVLNYIKGTLTDDRVSIEFGKECLLRILSQENCVGVRFTECKNTAGKNSLVAMGIVAERNDKGKLISVPLKKESYQNLDSTVTVDKVSTVSNDASDPLDEEEGNGSDSMTILENMGVSLENILSDKEDHVNTDLLIERLSTTITKSFFGLQ